MSGLSPKLPVRRDPGTGFALTKTYEEMIKQNLKNLGLLAILIGFQLQRGHIQIAYYTWLMIAIFVLYKVATSKFSPTFYYYLFGSLFISIE